MDFFHDKRTRFVATDKDKIKSEPGLIKNIIPGWNLIKLRIKIRDYRGHTKDINYPISPVVLLRGRNEFF